MLGPGRSEILKSLYAGSPSCCTPDSYMLVTKRKIPQEKRHTSKRTQEAVPQHSATCRLWIHDELRRLSELGELREFGETCEICKFSQVVAIDVTEIFRMLIV